jgi:hypothetical protein
VSLFCPTKREFSEVVPEGRTFDQSLIINISFPKIVGERSIFHYHFFLSLLLFNLRHANIFKICPTKLYGYTPTSFPGLFPFCHWEGGESPGNEVGYTR